MPAATRTKDRTNRRDERIIVRCTRAEKRRVVQEAEKADVQFSSFVRSRILDGAGVPDRDPSPRPKRVQSRDNLIKELSAIGNNLNQIARVANTTGEIKRAERIDELVEALMAKVPEIR